MSIYTIFSPGHYCIGDAASMLHPTVYEDTWKHALHQEHGHFEYQNKDVFVVPWQKQSKGTDGHSYKCPSGFIAVADHAAVASPSQWPSFEARYEFDVHFHKDELMLIGRDIQLTISPCPLPGKEECAYALLQACDENVVEAIRYVIDIYEAFSD